MTTVLLVILAVALLGARLGFDIYARKKQARGTAGFWTHNLVGPDGPRQQTFPYKRTNAPPMTGWRKAMLVVFIIAILVLRLFSQNDSNNWIVFTIYAVIIGVELAVVFFRNRRARATRR